MNTWEIEMICGRLNDKALETGFFNETADVLEATADNFVQAWCLEHQVTSHLITPLRWSFDEHGHEVRSGVIEFNPKARSADIAFTWVDLSESKITETPPPG